MIPFYLIGLVFVMFCFLPFFSDSALLGRYVCLTFFLLAGILITLRKTIGSNLRLSPVLLFYAFFILVNFLSAFWAVNPSESIFESSKVFLGFLVFLSSGYLFGKTNNYLPLVKTMIFVNLVYLVIVLVDLQSIGFNVIDEDLSDKITGLNGHKNQLAIFLFLSIPFSALGVISLEKYQKIPAIISLAGSLALILVLQTRSVWVGLSVTVLILGFANSSDIKKTLRSLPRLWLIAGISLICITAYFLYVTSEFTLEPNTLNARLQIWKNSILIFLDHPLLGVGSGNWKFVFASYGLGEHAEDIVNGVRIFQRPHNDFLWILSETGIVGFSLYAILLGSILYNSMKYFREISNREEKRNCMLILSIVVGYLVISFFTFPKERIEHIVLFNILLGLLHYQTNNYVLRFKGGKVTPVILKAITVLLLAGFLIIGVLRMKGDYYMQKWLEANKSRNNELALEMLMKAQSAFFTIDFLAIPIKWYEGLAHVSDQEFDKALEAFEDAYHINPNCLIVLNNLGSAYEMSGDRENAKLYYQKAIKISPNYDDARLNLASILYNEGNYKESMYWFNKVTNMEKKNPYSQIISNMEGKY